MVKTRFAPSPTGNLHVGNVRTAMFAYLYAKHCNGKFVLRIEDTDLERSKYEYTEKLIKDLQWLGIDWDEGPIVGGPNGPYLQSERLHIYKEWAEKLIKEGRAYYCYCTPEELEKEKEELTKEGKAPHYSGKCRNITAEQKRKYEKEGRIPSIRFVAYDEDFSFYDIVKEQVNFPKGMVGDFVIIRSNGLPVYNFAVTVDDALMEITHVLRADEHLSNTVRQLMIYKAMKYKPPEFAHMALVLGPDKQKLSKRHGATSIDEFRNLGYLPEALCNYLALLGWSSPDGREILTREELIKLFDLDRLNKSPAIFDIQKLDWMSKHYIIDADINRIFELSIPYILETQYVDKNFIDNNREFLMKAVNIARGYCSKLSSIKEHIGYFLNENYTIDKEAEEVLQKDSSKLVINKFIEILENLNEDMNEEIFRNILNKITSETGVKGKNLYMPLRAVVTGKLHGPEIYLIIPLIGKEKTLNRFKRIRDSYYK